jgi:hypothetical protein
MVMFKKLLVATALVACVVGCTKDNSEELKGYVEGCSDAITGLFASQGVGVDQVKVAEFCKEQGLEHLKNNK